jgi:hypothetical protein
MAGDQCYLFDWKSGLEQTTRSLMTQIVEVQVFDLEFIACPGECRSFRDLRPLLRIGEAQGRQPMLGYAEVHSSIWSGGPCAPPLAPCSSSLRRKQSGCRRVDFAEGRGTPFSGATPSDSRLGLVYVAASATGAQSTGLRKPQAERTRARLSIETSRYSATSRVLPGSQGFTHFEAQAYE